MDRDMRQSVILTILSIFATGFATAQIDSLERKQFDTTVAQCKDSTSVVRKNTVFAEVGGNGVIYSINYDRLFDVSEKFKLSGRIGVHFTNKFPLRYYRTISFPVEFSGLYSFYKKKHFIEFGSGLTYLNSFDNVTRHTEDIIILALRLGYRFQRPEGGFFMKIGFVPLYDWLVINPDPNVPHHTWLFFGGLGIGYTF